MPKDQPIYFDALLLILANIIWGATDVAAKFALLEMSPIALLWTRLSIALITLLPVLWIRRKEIPRTLSGMLPFIGLGLSGFALNFFLVYQGLSLAPASHATALRVSESLVILILAAIILREKVGARAILGLVAGIGGVVLVLNLDFRNLSLFTSGSRLGDLLILSGIIIEGFYTIIGKPVLKKNSPLLATALALLFGWLILTVIFGARVGTEFARQIPSIKSLLACAYLGIAASAFGFWIYYVVLSRRPSHRVGISIMLQPVIGIPLAYLVFRDPLTPKFLIGAALIAFGVYLALAKNETPAEKGG